MIQNIIASVEPFFFYLILINIAASIAFAIDYFIVCLNNDQDTGLMDGRIMSLFAVAGGPLGMFWR
ncbi:hypothetical protein [Arcanobacterium phocae]|uniref:hypothetical protein n=1 Tax=Arcanobacterium phocae TaxID=131112 RepID=UPI001C10DBBB|nr:hypothetical protein [Arcanobacterium phocae]